MSYSDPNFSFNPQKAFSFNPSNTKSINGTNPFPPDVSTNLYVPTCADKTNIVKDIYRQQTSEYVNMFGQTISYQPARYNFNTANFLYGEDPISKYLFARKMKAIINFSAYTSFLTKFGIMSDSEMVIYIPIDEFEKTWGPSQGTVFPLANDIFTIDDEACDRPLGQTPMCFQVTDKEDKINPVDFMGGHYIWELTCKRFDYSYEPNVKPERYLDSETSDSKDYGRLAGGDNPEEMGAQEYDVDEFGKKNFDNTESSKVYGRYL